jgi:hypothetical protein
MDCLGAVAPGGGPGIRQDQLKLRLQNALGGLE